MWLLLGGIVIGLLIAVYIVHRFLKGMSDAWW